MGVYFEIAFKQLKLKWTYRSNFYLGIVGNLFYFFLMISVWSVLYAGKADIRGVGLPQMITYTLISSVLGAVSSSGIAFTIAEQVRDGSIGNELVKPLNYKYLQVAQELGGNLFYSLCVTLPAAVLMGALYGFELPGAALDFALFAASAVLGAALMYTVSFLFGILAFWFKTAEYVAFLTSACMTLFSGSYVPLWLYPDWLYRAAMALPFRFVTYEPLAIYLGRYGPAQAAQILLFQVCWLAALLVLEKIMWRGVQRHLVIQGG